ncbi:MAG TPA: GIY-YIG nuclease family protein [Patescibacteria group bacterium]|nr:GIY-YIG nuclease family protein [Patescibacteria group bacterium]
MWYVYILLCGDNSLYTGSTNDLEKRFLDHKNGKGGKYTRSHRPLKLIYKEEFATKSEALKREAEIKSWSRGKKIKDLKLPVTG